MTRGRAWLVLAVVLLGSVWLLAPSRVPIYDGPGFPDEPYRYVAPPPGYRTTPPPTVARTVLKTRNTSNPTTYVNSDETGPQISIYLTGGTIRTPAGASVMTITATPLAPKRPLPRDGKITTDVYDIAATTPVGDATFNGSSTGSLLDMRAPSGDQPGPVFEHRAATGFWTRMPTSRVGNDIYETQLTAFGQWALVQLAGTHPTSSHNGLGALAATGIPIGLALCVIIGVRFIRRAPPE